MTKQDNNADHSLISNAPAEKIEALLESVNNASQHVRNFYITFLLVSFYIAVIIWSTTDVMLLKETPIKLPILDVELPITGFYTFAPFFYLLLHFNLLLQLCLLSDKLHRFDHAVSSLDDPIARNNYSARLFSFAFTHTLSGRHHSALLRFLLTLMVWITIIWLPLGLLIGLQVGFLAYHGEDILLWQRLAIALDLIFLTIFWPIIRSLDGTWFSWFVRATGIPLILSWVNNHFVDLTTKQSKTVLALTQHNHTKPSGKPLFEGSLSLITMVLVIAFSWVIAVLPDSDREKQVASWLTDSTYFNWKSTCPSKETGGHYFKLTEQLFDGIYSSEEECLKKPQDSIFNRNLRLREQLLIANELKAEDEADLTHENETIRKEAFKKVTQLILSGRDFRYADFSEARLPKVDFVGANEDPSDLRYANFSNAMLTDARMHDTKLQGANLYQAELKMADLRWAELQRASLFSTNLQRADLTEAYLQGANLFQANLQEANFTYANLQGAVLTDAILQKTHLSGAYLQGAVLTDAKLQGALLDNETDLSLADISRTEFEPAVIVIKKEKTITQPYDSENILYSDIDRIEHENSLTAYLIDLSCKDKWTALGIIHHRINRYSRNQMGQHKYFALATHYAQCMLFLKNQKHSSGELVCPAMSNINEDTIRLLEEIETLQESKNAIQQTFTCHTDLLDPPPETVATSQTSEHNE